MRIHLKAGRAIGALVLASGTLLAVHAYADIEKIAQPTEDGLEFIWWPKVTPPAGWVHHREVSVENHINMFVPEGESFADSPVVLYARAIYFETGNTGKELEDAIRDDRQGFLEHFPGSKIAA